MSSEKRIWGINFDGINPRTQAAAGQEVHIMTYISNETAPSSFSLHTATAPEILEHDNIRASDSL